MSFLDDHFDAVKARDHREYAIRAGHARDAMALLTGDGATWLVLAVDTVSQEPIPHLVPPAPKGPKR